MSGQVVDLGAYRAKRYAVPAETWERKPQIAARFGVSERTVERWVKRGFPCKHVGARLVLFPVEECSAWVADHD